MHTCKFTYFYTWSDLDVYFDTCKLFMFTCAYVKFTYVGKGVHVRGVLVEHLVFDPQVYTTLNYFAFGFHCGVDHWKQDSRFLEEEHQHNIKASTNKTEMV